MQTAIDSFAAAIPDPLPVSRPLLRGADGPSSAGDYSSPDQVGFRRVGIGKDHRPEFLTRSPVILADRRAKKPLSKSIRHTQRGTARAFLFFEGAADRSAA